MSVFHEREEALIKDYGGILPYHEVFYIRSIRFSAQASLDSFHRFATKLQNNDHPHEDIFYALYTALSHAAAVSRYFWPSQKKGIFAARAVKLRLAFSIGDAHPLENRQLRNALEHFDERLDGFLANDPMGVVLDLIVTSTPLNKSEAGHVFRYINPTTGKAFLFGEQYDFDSVHTAIAEIFELALSMEVNGRLRMENNTNGY